MSKTLKQLCDDIEAGYAADKSGLDDDMIELLAELSNKTGEIKELIELVERYKQAEIKELTRR
jgi:hypothetical protein